MSEDSSAQGEVPDLPHACAVCWRALEHVGGHGWRHTILDRDADHPAVPVPTAEGVVRGRCDLCTGEPVVSVIECDPIRIAGVTHAGDLDELGRLDTLWSCCEVCTRLIRKGRWAQLSERASRACAAQVGEPWTVELGDSIRELHQTLAQTLRSGPHRLPPAD